MKFDFNSLKFRNLVYYIAFSVIILVLLWVLQVIFLKSYYKAMKTNEITRIGNEIVKNYYKDDENDWDTSLKKYAFANNISILVLDSNGHIVNNADTFSMFAERKPVGMPANAIYEIKSKLSPSNSVITYTEGRHDQLQIVYTALLNDSTGEDKYIHITCPLMPVDSTVEVLKNQFIIVTVIIFLLSIIIAQIISRKLSSQILRLTQSAKELAKGNIDATFEKGDYTEINQLAEALTYATQEISKLDEYRKDFIANVSHDLRTPLTIIKCYGEMIRDISGDNVQKRNAHCEIIIKETDRLTGLVNEVLELSKLQSDNAQIIVKDFDISKCVKEVLSGFQVLSEMDGYIFKKDIDASIIVKGDEQYIKRVIYNLVSNAVNYTGDDKSVAISLKAKNNRVRFEVTDTGKGIPDDQLQNIWERYYKAKETHKRAVVGTGLGLSIVKNILAMHNAKFGVNTKVDNGSTFWFEFETSKPIN